MRKQLNRALEAKAAVDKVAPFSVRLKLFVGCRNLASLPLPPRLGGPRRVELLGLKISSSGPQHCIHMQELSEARSQLSAEQGKVFKLEVELAEARQKLQGVAELERELSHYR